MSSIKFQKPTGFSTGIEYVAPDRSYADIRLMALSEGKYTDMSGISVDVTAEVIDNIVEVYNKTVEEVYKEDLKLTPELATTKLEEFDNRNAPNQLDHKDSETLMTVGHVIGFMNSKKINGKNHLFMKVRVKGRNEVECVTGGEGGYTKKWRNVSVQYSPENYMFEEVSWVVKGADSSARALLSAPNIPNSNSEIRLTFNKVVDTIHTRQELINNAEVLLGKLKRKYDAEKYLIALCRTGKLNMTRANKVKAQLHKFDDPKSAVALLDCILPKPRLFQPKIINDAEVINKLLDIEGTKMAQSNIDVPETFEDALRQNIKLGSDKEIQESFVNKDNVLGYNSDKMEHHKKLMDKSSSAYEDGDVEMGRKYSEKAKKFAEACSGDDDVNMSEYQIEDETSESEDAKKMSKKLGDMEAELSAMKKDFTIALSELTKATVKLSEKQVAEVNNKELVEIKKVETLIAGILTEINSQGDR